MAFGGFIKGALGGGAGSILAGTGLALGDSLIGAKGSRDAAKYALQGTQAGIAEQRRQFDISQQNLQPWQIAARGEPIYDDKGKITGYTGGALQEYGGYGQSKVLEGDYIPASEIPEFDPNVDVYQDPGYKFRQQEQERAINRAAAGQGKFLSGNRLEEIMKRSGELASQEYGQAYNRAVTGYGLQAGREADMYSRGLGAYTRAAGREQDYLNRLWQIAEAGRGATGTTAQLGASTAANIANLQQAGGEARAAGAIGQSAAIRQGIGDITALGTRYLSGSSGIGGGGSYTPLGLDNYQSPDISLNTSRFRL